MTSSRSEEFELVTWGKGGRFTRCNIDKFLRYRKTTMSSGTRGEPSGKAEPAMLGLLRRRLRL